MDDNPSGATDHRLQPARRNRGVGAIATVLGIVCVAFGAYTVWAQRTGVVADVKVLECHQVGRRSHICSGQWQDGTVTRPVSVVATPLPDPGATVPMRIHDDKAYSQSAQLPLLSFGLGAVMLLIGWYALGRRRQGS